MSPDTMTVQEGYEGLSKEIIPVKDDGVCCIDGRYEESGMLSRAGADFGLIMGVMATSEKLQLGYSPEECAQMVYDFATKHHGYFDIHTDSHNSEIFNDDSLSIGCAHVSKAMNGTYSHMYSLTPGSVERALKWVVNKENTRVTVLEGDHAETEVVIVDSMVDTILHKSQDGSMRFVIDSARDVKYLRSFCKEHPEFDFETLHGLIDTQNKATLSLIASKLPIIRMSI